MSSTPLARVASGALALAAFVAQAGCGGESGNTGNISAALTGACGRDTRVGGFSVALFAASDISAFSQFGGAVFDSVDPVQVWSQQATVGACSLWTGPGYTCGSACDSQEICVAQDQCELHTIESSGTVTLKGFGSPRAEPFNGGYVDLLAGAPYPPAAAGAPVSLSGDGGTTGPFTLHGEGIEPLAFDGSALTLVGGQNFTFTWTLQAQPGMERIQAVVDVGEQGGVQARIECDLPDSGSATIDGGLIASLVSYGIHGFPSIYLTRQTADSITLAPGCVDFSVTSSVESTITACASPGDCVVSCACGGPGVWSCVGGSSQATCPTGTTCQLDFTCAKPTS